MAETRILTLNEERTLICALAEARTKAYVKAIKLRDKSTEMENEGQSGYLALDDEAELYEMAADVSDLLIGLVCEGRIVILKEDRQRDE